jgi:hypothetical protein
MRFSRLLLIFLACGVTACGTSGGGPIGGYSLPDVKNTGGKDGSEQEVLVGTDGDVITSGDACTNCLSDGTDNGGNDAFQPGDDAVQPGSDVIVDAGPGYTGPACTKNSVCQDLPDTPYCAIMKNQCVQCLFDANCTDPQKCVEFQCKTISCTPGSKKCNGLFLDVCNATGNGFDTQSCPDGKPFCLNDDCRVCDAGKDYCAKSDPSIVNFDVVMQCSSDGTSTSVLHQCASGEQCLNNECMVCVPGSKACDANGAATECKSDGSGWNVTKDCAANGWACVGGLCTDPCAGDIKANTNVGCDYFAVDLDNVFIPDGKGGNFDAQNAQFSVIVSNTKPAPATVTVIATDTTGLQHQSKYTVQANGLKILNLPDPLWKIKPLNQDGTAITKNVYRIKSNQPIVAYQFNPLQDVGVFSNDASLLLPSNGLGQEYWVMTREQSVDALKSYFTVVATSTQKTHVKMVLSAPTVAGPNLPALNAGDVMEVDLAEGEVLNVESNKIGSDMTGTWVKADKPIAVFGGSEASNSPNTDHCINGKCEFQGWTCKSNADCPTTCCSDHMEEQLFPVSSWGTTYLATKVQKRGKEKDAWRILASQDGTTVTTDPPQTNVPVLNQGQWHEFESDQDFVIKSDKPILVGQFMAASFAPGPNSDTCSATAVGQKVCAYTWNVKDYPWTCSKNADCPNLAEAGDAGIGDPDFSLSVSTDRYLDDYVFLVPSNYKANYINVMAPTGAKMTLDGTPLTGFGEFVPGWSVLRTPIAPGSHALKSAQKVGLLVYGWADFVSYSYPGGASLK